MAAVFVALGAFVILTFTDIWLVSGQSEPVPKTIVANSDPQITYFPAFCSGAKVTSCMGAWWDTNLDNGSVIKTTAGPSSGYRNAQTSLSYSFYGTSLEIHGLGDVDGANMMIQIDNLLVIVNTSTGIGGALQKPFLIYNYSQLDPQTIHTLSVGWSANENPNTDAGGYDPLSYVYFDHLVIGNFSAVADATSALSSSATSSPSAIASSTQSTSSQLKPGALAAIIVAILLLVILLCSFSFYFLRYGGHHKLRRGQSPSRHIRVMIESQETQHAECAPSPTPSESWKPRPHLSLPPVYGCSKEGGNPDKTGYGAEKDVSYLDLESGGKESMEGSSSFPSISAAVQDRRQSRLSLLAVSLSPSRSSRVSYPPRAKLRVNTRESVIAPRHHRFSGVASTEQPVDEHDLSPITPFTPYAVGTATFARAQNAQLVPNSSIGSTVGPSTSSVNSMPPLPPLPPLPPMPSPREEKRRLAQHLLGSRRSREVSRAQGPEPKDRQSSGATLKLPESNGLDFELNATARSSRPSFDAMSIMTRSVPPPYALHV